MYSNCKTTWSEVSSELRPFNLTSINLLVSETMDFPASLDETLGVSVLYFVGIEEGGADITFEGIADGSKVVGADVACIDGLGVRCESNRKDGVCVGRAVGGLIEDGIDVRFI